MHTQNLVHLQAARPKKVHTNIELEMQNVKIWYQNHTKQKLGFLDFEISATCGTKDLCSTKKLQMARKISAP